jgi:hypothetical protein
MERSTFSTLTFTLAVAAGALADPPTGCYKWLPANCTSSGSGYCAGEVTSCDQGWTNAGANEKGVNVTGWELSEVFCVTYKQCGPIPCNPTNPPPGRDMHCAPNSNGQCCWCEEQTGGEWTGSYIYTPTGFGSECTGSTPGQ